MGEKYYSSSLPFVPPYTLSLQLRLSLFVSIFLVLGLCSTCFIYIFNTLSARSILVLSSQFSVLYIVSQFSLLLLNLFVVFLEGVLFLEQIFLEQVLSHSKLPSSHSKLPYISFITYIDNSHNLFFVVFKLSFYPFLHLLFIFCSNFFALTSLVIISHLSLHKSFLFSHQFPL